MYTLLLLAQLASVQFYTKVSPDTLYVGQQATYDAVVLIPQELIRKMSKNPQYYPSEIRGASVYEFAFDESRMDDISLRGIVYKRVVFRRGVFPLVEGGYRVEPATVVVTYNDPVSGEREETFKSEPVTFYAKPLPETGRPVDFAGAVGQYTDTAFVDANSVKVGENIVLTMRILGGGDVMHIPRPLVSLEWGSVLESEERVNWDSTGSFVRGYKEFDWIITPTVAGKLFIPAIRFEHFNPNVGNYMVSSTRPIPITTLGRSSDLVDSFRPDGQHISTSPLPYVLSLMRDYWLITIGVAAVLLFLVIFLIVRASQRRARYNFRD